MTPHRSEVCVLVSHLSRGARVKNPTASLQIFVYLFTLYFVKIDVRRCQKSKNIILVGAVSPWQQTPHLPLRNGPKGISQEDAVYLGSTQS